MRRTYFGNSEVSSEIFPIMPEKKKRPKKRGDSALLDRLRRAMGASQARTGKTVEWQELAKAAHLGASTMTDITTLDRRVTIAEAVAFADYLGVEFAWLAAGRGPMVGDGSGATMPPGLQYAPGNALKLDAEIAARATRPKRRAKDVG